MEAVADAKSTPARITPGDSERTDSILFAHIGEDMPKTGKSSWSAVASVPDAC
jgi:hypothetical protein